MRWRMHVCVCVNQPSFQKVLVSSTRVVKRPTNSVWSILPCVRERPMTTWTAWDVWARDFRIHSSEETIALALFEDMFSKELFQNCFHIHSILASRPNRTPTSSGKQTEHLGPSDQQCLIWFSLAEVFFSFHSLYFVTWIFSVSILCLLCEVAQNLFCRKLSLRSDDLSLPHSKLSKVCQPANDLLKISQAWFWSRQPTQSEQALDMSWHSDLWARSACTEDSALCHDRVCVFDHLRSLHWTGDWGYFEPANKCVGQFLLQNESSQKKKQM